jgi:hypothetical protein
MLNLSQLLIQRSTSRQSTCFPKLAIHEAVLIDENTLCYFDYLDGYDQWDGYHGVDEYDIGEERYNTIDCCCIAEWYIGIGSSMVAVEYASQYCTNNTEYYLYQQYKS